MTAIDFPNADALSDAYVGLLGPEAYDATRTRHIRLVGEDDGFLADFHARSDEDRAEERPWRRDLDGPEPDFGETLGRDEPFERVKALRSYWSSSEYDDYLTVHSEREGDIWPCEPVDPARAAILMMQAAPNVAFTVSGDQGETVGLSWCWFTGRRRTATRGVPSAMGRHLQVAVAYLCCGYLPPRGLLIEALPTVTPATLDPQVLAGLRAALASVTAATDEASRILGPGSAPV